MKNFKQYFVTTIGMGILTIYYVSRFFEIDVNYLFQITIFILSVCLLIKLFYWYNISKSSERENLLRFSFLVLTYFLPIYMIIQEPTLIIDITILKISFLIIFIFAFIGILIERHLFILKKNFEFELKKITKDLDEILAISPEYKSKETGLMQFVVLFWIFDKIKNERI